MSKFPNLKRVAFITGDVHHPPDFIKRVYYKETKRVPDYELKAAREYAKILYEYEASCTLFMTGRLVDMFPEAVVAIARMPNVEIGAHTYYAFRGPLYGYTLLIPLYKRVFGTSYGPRLLIKHDVLKVVYAFRKLKLDVKAWRTHGYEGDEYLYELLAKKRFRIVSDCKSDSFRMFSHHGLVHVCINMPVDDNIPKMSQHERTEWYRRYYKVLDVKAERGEPLVLQLHPANMALDNFDFLIGVVKRLKAAGYKLLKLSDVVCLLS